MRRRLVLALLFAVTLHGPSRAAELTGAASPIGETFCGRSVEVEEPLLRCPGPAGVDAYLHLEAGRAAISLGDPIEGFVSIGARNSLGSTMEWRSSAGIPFAGIVRFRVPRPDEKDGDIFAILKVAENGRAGCLASLVDATVNPQARDLARRTADSLAPSFACGVDEPRFYGISSDWARGLPLQ